MNDDSFACLEVLERLVLTRDGQSDVDTGENSVSAQIHQAALLLANSLSALIGNNGTKSPRQMPIDGQSTASDILPNRENDLLVKRNVTDTELEDIDRYPSKKTRRESEHFAWLSYVADSEDLSMLLPPTDLLEKAVELYFGKIHPWIPCIHQANFLARWRNESEARNLTILVHAMLSVSMRHLPFQSLGLKEADIDRQVRLSREVVVRNAMGHLSLENVQALIIITFDHVGICFSCFSAHGVALLTFMNYSWSKAAYLTLGL
jgi:hypothetical protein